MTVQYAAVAPYIVRMHRRRQKREQLKPRWLLVKWPVERTSVGKPILVSKGSQSVMTHMRTTNEMPAHIVRIPKRSKTS